ncbi:MULTISPECIES: gamma-glutamyl-gamma-aminobutyrate hydrolase family protein [Streptomyces]|uniref:gamma-glutamyl-gamma-aminobutyrate hydrolase family protein n=1 Tax=Streptomyces TaxID=1883 RepID=UPI000F73B593|nr:MULTISPECIES: gamma-glutamyl-gamma-aminobutyrate hydrolase family protein [Streptomyces]MCM3263996.1 gamma-glutamyl-gamma-aminobutyrate hydrolase family protein [Streptomyces thermoviolaceus]RSS00313.1 gamma-glutamyl-gamma-aminobutyrate hydrolase family protein [Streptomyces sp. WAC00469]GGV67892.1 gamma-glutamyl-gamma-aminobutyrate hydrolase [Streptomyces thermoviolaceus subsp. apingens]
MAAVPPLIGVSTYLEADTRWGVWRLEAALLPAAYPRLVQRAGGLAVLLPPDAPERAARTVARLDGLVIAGGPDVEPARYGAEPDPRTGPPDRARDAWELALIGAALAARLPLLGICRGMQLLNVALGGTLVQHLDGHGGPAAGVFGSHPVRPVTGTRCAAAVPEETVVVPTYHHQAVGRLGAGLIASAHAADGTVEAVEPASGGPWVLGVQWHPEMSEDLRVMRALVHAAGEGGRTDGDGSPGGPSTASAPAAVSAP